LERLGAVVDPQIVANPIVGLEWGEGDAVVRVSLLRQQGCSEVVDATVTGSCQIAVDLAMLAEVDFGKQLTINTRGSHNQSW
jgi:hypothetical protein